MQRVESCTTRVKTCSVDAIIELLLVVVQGLHLTRILCFRVFEAHGLAL